MRRAIALAALLLFAVAPSVRAQAIGGSTTPAPSTTTTDTNGGDDRMPGGIGSGGGIDVRSREIVPSNLLNPVSNLAGAVDPKAYRVGPGDVLMLYLWGGVSKTSPLEVGPEGTLLIPGSGPLHVDGMTLAAVRDAMFERLRSQFRGVRMDLRLARPRQFRVYLTGQVKDPGPVSATGTSRVSDVLGAGVLLDDASRRRIEVIHRDGTREYTDVERFLKIGDATHNPWLRDGDVVNVPVATTFVYAEGALARPGRFELGPSDSLRDLILLAGETVRGADPQHALMIRWRDPVTPESLWFDLAEVRDGRVNPPLGDGSRVYVYFVPQYHLQHQVEVRGEVNRPGVYPILEGRDRLSDIVEAAGGFTQTADLTAIRTHRGNAATGERDQELERMLRLSRNDMTVSEYEKLRAKLASLREDYRVDWTRLKRDEDIDLPLRDDDVIRVDRLLNSIRIDGEVRRPGILTFVPGQSVESYVAESGGFTDRAWRSKTRVIRTVTGQALLARNVSALGPGDIVWVPEKPDVTLWQQTRDVLTGLASIATVIIAIRSVN